MLVHSFRDIAVGLSSFGVIVLLVLYAVAGPTPKLNANFGPVVPRPGATAVVQGRILNSGGGGLDGATIVVDRHGTPVGRAVSDSAGTFRIDLRGTCALYRISVRAHDAGSNVEKTAQRQLCPGDALPVDAQVATEGHFIWVPGPR